jgi:hypothetical protein
MYHVRSAPLKAPCNILSPPHVRYVALVYNILHRPVPRQQTDVTHEESAPSERYPREAFAQSCHFVSHWSGWLYNRVQNYSIRK